MSIFGWRGRPSPEPASVKPSAAPGNKRPKVNKDLVKERALKNSPWRFDDGPSRRPVGKN